METYKNIQITNYCKITVARCKAMIDTLYLNNYALYEVMLTLNYKPVGRIFTYTTCLHEDANKTLTLK